MTNAAQIPWTMALAVFLGTLPILGTIVWNLAEVKTLRTEMRNEFAAIRVELSAIKEQISSIRERVATLEERDRHTQLVKP